jgi:hypothetical protein
LLKTTTNPALSLRKYKQPLGQRRAIEHHEGTVYGAHWQVFPRLAEAWARERLLARFLAGEAGLVGGTDAV